METELGKNDNCECEPILTPWSILLRPNCRNYSCLKEMARGSLRKVINEEFYHIDTKGTLKEGEQYSTNGVYNNFLNPQVLEAIDHDYMEYNNIRHDLDRRLLANKEMIEKFGHEADELCGTYNDYLKRSLDAFGHFIKLIRECVFEEVRCEFFSCLPSRLCCLWVIPDAANKRESIKHWLNETHDGGSNGRKIAKLELNGCIFTADETYLPYSSMKSLNELRKCAFKYWSGCSVGKPENTECLFQGNFKVLKVYTIEDVDSL